MLSQIYPGAYNCPGEINVEATPRTPLRLGFWRGLYSAYLERTRKLSYRCQRSSSLSHLFVPKEKQRRFVIKAKKISS